MTTFAELLAPIQSSPFPPELVDELSNILVAERQLRRIFCEEMTPEMKVEFIKGEVALHYTARNRHLDVTMRIANAAFGIR